MSAIWLLPNSNVYGNWPKSGEIDILEIVGFDPCTAHFTVQTEKYHFKIGAQKDAFTELDAPYEQYHVYSLEWDSDMITILVDGVPYLTYERNGSRSRTIWPFNQRFYLIMNISVGGYWESKFGIDRTVFPQQMVVDYVRVYQKR